MSHYFDDDKKRWRFSFNRIINDQRIRATKLLPKGWSKAQAEQYDHDETKRLYAVARGIERPEPLIAEGLAFYLDNKCNPDAAKPLKNGRRIALELAHLVPYIEGKTLSQLPEVCTEYLKTRPELSSSTKHNRLAYLKAACRYAWKKKDGFSQNDPTGRMEIPQPNNERIVRESVAEAKRIIRAIEDRKAKALFTLAFYCGLRWQLEAWPRQPSDVMREGGEVGLFVGYTKNGEPLIVPVNPEARWALSYLPFNEWGESYYRDRFDAARAKVGKPKFRRHDLRHVLGADVLKRTNSQRDAMAALHHLSYQSSIRYTIFATSRLREVLYGVGGAKKVHTSGRGRAMKRAA